MTSGKPYTRLFNTKSPEFLSASLQMERTFTSSLSTLPRLNFKNVSLIIEHSVLKDPRRNNKQNLSMNKC